MTIVEQIHQEIDSAHAKLLDTTDQYSKAIKLAAIGFKQVPVVREYELYETVQYYHNTYPFLKFLTENELKRICDKYNLVIHPIENYIGDVPEKNADEILNAQELKATDEPEDVKYAELTKDNTFFLTSGNSTWSGIWGSEWYKIPKRIDGMHFSSIYHANDYLNDLGFTCKYLVGKVVNVTESRTGLFICAPKEMFKGKNNKISRAEAKDPIVFRYVRGGVQVLSKWGLEANDPSMINPKMN